MIVERPMLESKQLQQYSEDGYCRVDELIPRSFIDAARERVHEMIEDQPDWADHYWQLLDPQFSRNQRGQALPIGIQRPAHNEAVFDQIAHHPRLIQAMSEILGGEVSLFTDQIGVKHGCLTNEQGGRSYYHQDSYYWHIDPALGVNCWIPLDVVDRDQIALGIKPGSQRGWKLSEHEHYYDEPAAGRMADGVFQPYQRHRVPLGQIDTTDEIIFPMNPGDALFFTNYTWHRSEPNRSGETKIFYAIAYKLTEAAIAQRKATGTLS